MIVSSFQQHFYPVLPKIVINDINAKVKSRAKRQRANMQTLEQFARESTQKAIKLAPFIESRYPFSVRNVDRTTSKKFQRTSVRRIKKSRQIQSEINIDFGQLTHDILMDEGYLERFAEQLVLAFKIYIRDFDCPPEWDELEHMIAIYQAFSSAFERLGLRSPSVNFKSGFSLHSAILRLTDNEYVLNQLNKLKAQYIEYSQITLNRVGKQAHQSKYVSQLTLNNFLSNQAKQARFLENYCLYDDNTGAQVDLETVFNSGVSNPENRRIEMMVRSRGFEELAASQGYIGIFITWTLASKYHRSSKKWHGASPKEGHKNLMSQWAGARAQLAKQNLDYFGFRVAEPHKDATPHAHYFLFCSPQNVGVILSILARIARSEDKLELDNKETKKARFLAKICDPSKGGATAYIAKYIAKNLNGSHIDDPAAFESAKKVRAWASLWGIRQFQQFGGQPVSLWRALRKVSKEDITKHAKDNDKLIELHESADNSRWKDFVEQASIATLEYDTKKNRFMETVKKMTGFSVGKIFISTRTAEWKIVKKSQVQSLRGGASSWSTENKCNPTLEKPISPLEKSLIDITGWTLKGVQCLIKPLSLGATMQIDKHQAIKLRNNQLVVA